MAYAEGYSYITHATWGVLIGTAQLTELGIADDSTSLLFRETASGLVDEYAIAGGATVPLAAARLTAAMKRRVAVIAAFNAADPKQKFRNAQGLNPFHAQREIAIEELEAWVKGLLGSPGDVAESRTPSTSISNTDRRWQTR